MRGESLVVHRVVPLTLTLPRAAGERAFVYGNLLSSGLRIPHVFSGLVGKGERRKKEAERIRGQAYPAPSCVLSEGSSEEAPPVDADPRIRWYRDQL